MSLKALADAVLARNTPRNDRATVGEKACNLGGPDSQSALHSDAPHYRWRVTLAEGNMIEVCCLPQLTGAEMQERYPGARLIPLPDSPGEAEQCMGNS
jgi:hypothetical protein